MRRRSFLKESKKDKYIYEPLMHWFSEPKYINNPNFRGLAIFENSIRAKYFADLFIYNHGIRQIRYSHSPHPDCLYFESGAKIFVEVESPNLHEKLAGLEFQKIFIDYRSMRNRFYHLLRSHDQSLPMQMYYSNDIYHL